MYDDFGEWGATHLSLSATSVCIDIIDHFIARAVESDAFLSVEAPVLDLPSFRFTGKSVGT